MIARRSMFLCFGFEIMLSFCFWGVTGPGYWLVLSIVGYSVSFMIEFDTHDVLCLVSSIV